MALERLAFLPDTHRPYHDKRAWDLFIKAMRWWRPHRVIVKGDFSDCAPISSHSKDPTRLLRFQEEIDDVNAGLDELDSLGARKYHFIEGNHEFRLQRYLQEKAPELIGLRDFTIPSLFRLNQRGWSYTPYKQHLKIGHLYITHEVGNAGGQAHVQARSAFESNVVIGHTHRMAVHYAGNAQGKTKVGAMFGWLGDLNRIDYMHRVQAKRNWQLGFGIGHMEPNGIIHLQAIPIINYRVVIDGRLIK